jgi:hypothetical protein
VGLSAEVVNLVWPDVCEQSHKPCPIAEVAVMEKKLRIGIVWIYIKMVNACCIERRSAPDQSVYFIALPEQELREV